MRQSATVFVICILLSACSDERGRSPSTDGGGGSGDGSTMDGGTGTPDARIPPTVDSGVLDAGTEYCGPDSSVDAGSTTPTPDCSGGAAAPGCLCDTVGATQTCTNGRTMTCNAYGEFGGKWGPCLGTCFSSGTWAIDNLVPCFIGDGTTTYAFSSSLVSGMADCGGMVSSLPPPMPTSDWSTDSLTVDCQGQFTLCYTLKAGDGSAPTDSDCTVARVCTSGYYAEANVTQALPPLSGWLGTDTACAQAFLDEGGYGEMSVVGLTIDCEQIDDGAGGEYVFNRVTYCPSCCNDGSCSSDPLCSMCGMGGSGGF